MNILADELSKPAYAGLSDQAAADAINAKTVAVEQPVAISTLKQYAILQGVWPKIKLGQQSSNQQQAALCMSILDWVEDPRIGTINVNMLEVKAMLSALVGFSILSQQQVNEVVAMGGKVVSWTSTVGLPEIGIGLVRNARKEIAGVNL
tara:strand:+ start:1241 stop:1687 length:447 start_codon:yes stop_codon:yes gene_type:complete